MVGPGQGRGHPAYLGAARSWVGGDHQLKVGVVHPAQKIVLENVQENIHQGKESNCNAMKLIDNHKSSEEDGLESDGKEIGKNVEKNVKKRRRKISGKFN
mgnify:CR=1 FL=1